MNLRIKFRRSNLLIGMVGVVLVALFAIACSSSEPAAPAAPSAPAPAPAAPAPAAPASVGQPGAGENLTMLIVNVGNGRIDPWTADGEDLKHQRMFNVALVGGKGGSELTKGVTSDWQMAPDAMSWVFTVSDGLSFQNGDPLTAKDVHFSLDRRLGKEGQRLLDSGYAEPRDYADAKFFESIEMGPADNQVTVNLKERPRPDLAFNQSENSQSPAPMVIPEAYTKSQIKDGDLGHEGYEKAPVGAGPMKLTNFVLEQKYEFERWEDFWWHPGNGYEEDRRFKFETMTMEVVTEDATRVAAIQSGAADMVEANVRMIDQLESINADIAWQDESAYNWIVMVDCWTPDLWCFPKEVRQAVEYAFDSRTVVGQLYGRGGSVTGWGHVTPNSLGYSTDLDPRPYDPQKARDLLASVGIVDGKKDGKQIEFSIYTWDAGDTPFLPDMSRLMADAWQKELGFKVDVVVGDAAGVRQQWNNRQLPASVLVRTNEARFDGTSISQGAWLNPEIAWRAISSPDDEPWASTSVPVVRKALGNLDPATRGDSFNEMYKFLKDEAHWWSAFNTNLPWGSGSRIKPGSYKPWKLVPYVTAVWTVELK